MSSSDVLVPLKLPNYNNKYMSCNMYLQREEDDGPDIPGAVCRPGTSAKCSRASAKGASACASK